MLKKFFSKISNKIIFFTGLSLLIMALLIVIPFTYITYRADEKQITDLEKRLNDNFDLVLRNEVETAISMLQDYADRINNGDFTQEDGQKQAADALRKLKFGTSGYFWADTKQGDNVVLPGKPEVEGTNRMASVDSKGNHFIESIINNGLKGGGYSEYWFPKKGENVPLPKRSYSKLFEPFGWIVGTGNYIDDIQVIVAGIKNEREADLARRISMITIITILTVLIMLMVAYFIGRRISKPIVELSAETESIAKGNLTVEVVAHQNDEVGVLSKSINQMVIQLRKIVEEISEGSANVVTASGQMSNASQLIAEGASEQAASSEQISTSVQQMAANIIQNTENANRAENITETSMHSITELRNAFKETLDAMTDIAAKSLIIKDISLQTNLLALNAAVEAARAGEAGRGFSVVAGEVRKLSDHTQKAAHDIDAITHNSLDIAQRSWDLLEQLLPEFQQTSMLVKEINVASTEQKTGANQINSAIMQMVNVTSQNSAAAEQLASSAEELASQAENLKESIGFFTLR